MSTSFAARLAYKLEGELAWRKRELISVYMDIPNDELLPICRTKCRQAILLLYSHWEGFAKRAFKYYLQEVAATNTDPRLLRSELLGLCLQSRVKAAAERKIPHEIGNQLKSISDLSVSLPAIPVKRSIKTRSNLSGTVLREILETIGLDPTKYAAFEADPIHTLLRSRNAIAHGEGIPVPLASYKRLHHSIIDLMDSIREYLEVELASSSYLG